MKEYKIVKIDVSMHTMQGAEDQINKLTKEGWEVKFVVPAHQNNYIHIYTLERFILTQ